MLQKIRNRLTIKKLTAIFILLLTFFTLRNVLTGTSTDDWRYSGPRSEVSDSWGKPLILLAAAMAIIWLGISLSLILRSKPQIQDDPEAQFNRRRKLGGYLLLGPFVFLLAGVVAFILIDLIPVLTVLFVPGILIAYLVYVIKGISRSVNLHVKKALIPLIGPPLIVGILVIKSITDAFFGLDITSGGISESIRSAPAGTSGDLGFSTGGAKDIDNFRENVANNYLPLTTDITYEGLFYDYYFDTGQKQPCNELFCPSYSYAISRDPFSQKPEYYLSVGLNSGIKETDFERKKLNLVIVLDISGSMGSPFDRYYYDQQGSNRPFAENPEDLNKTKMTVATESIVALLEHLNKDDRFGMVLFDDNAYLAKPLRRIGATDMAAIKNHILELTPQGGTRMSAGLKQATKLFDDYDRVDQTEYENRTIFLTDAQPNLGGTSPEGLLGMTDSNAENNIYTTFIGIGVDFNTDLIEKISKIRGANYYSVHSPGDFKSRMDDEFEYMVTPLVFNLNMKLESDGYRIEKVFGSPEANEATGEIMKVNTLFPSKRVEEETRGGLVLLKLTKLRDDGTLQLSVNYEDRSGRQRSNSQAVTLTEQEPDYYQNTGIRKGILLTRYANLMKNWIIQERARQDLSEEPEPRISIESGIPIPDYPEPSRWERQSIPLRVSDRYQKYFATFYDYFRQEAAEVDDQSLDREARILEKLAL